MKFRTSFLVLLFGSIIFGFWYIYFDSICVESVTEGEVVEIHQFGRSPELEVAEDIQIVHVLGWPTYSKILNQSRVRVVRNVRGEFKLHDMVRVEGVPDDFKLILLGKNHHGHLIKNQNGKDGVSK